MKRLSWRRVNVTLLKLLHLHDSPKKTAAAFAIGIFWGLSPVTPPFLGLQTGMALLCALVFRLNKIAAFIGTLITNPYTFLPVYGFGTYVGSRLLGYHLHVSASITHFLVEGFRWAEKAVKALFVGNFATVWHEAPRMHDFKSLVKAYFVGNFVTATVVSVAAYFITSWLLARYRRLREARRAGRDVDS